LEFFLRVRKAKKEKNLSAMSDLSKNIKKLCKPNYVNQMGEEK